MVIFEVILKLKNNVYAENVVKDFNGIYPTLGP